MTHIDFNLKIAEEIFLTHKQKEKEYKKLEGAQTVFPIPQGS
jgi:hypothetical protein